MSSSSSSTEIAVTTGAILGIGNPLLDISAHVTNEFCAKYGVSTNNAILAEEKHQPLYSDLVKSFPVEYIAGGATQNSIRVAQWMLQKPGSTTYLGCVGRDAFGAELRAAATADGVRVLYDEDDKEATGTCAVLIVEKERGLVANLAAANKFKQSHLNTTEVSAAIEQAKIVYSAGFFLTVSPPSLMQIAEHVSRHNKILAINLAAPFIPSFFAGPLSDALSAADFVFGNETEAEAWATQQKLTDPKDISAVALALAAYPSTRKSVDGVAARARTAVITQGSRHTLVAQSGAVRSFDVPKLDSSLIVDSNGAGDAFVGGFLSQLVQGAAVEKCVDAGHYAARCIIQVSGTKLSGKPNFA